MSASTLRIAIAVFLIAHGLVHYSLTTVPAPAPRALRTPFWPGWWRADTDPAWLASKLGLSTDTVRTLGWMLWVATVIGFALAGLGLLGVPGLKTLWQATATFGSAASLILLVFYWHSWLVLGAAIDVAVLLSLWLRWPSALFHAQ